MITLQIYTRHNDYYAVDVGKAAHMVDTDIVRLLNFFLVSFFTPLFLNREACNMWLAFLCWEMSNMLVLYSQARVPCKVLWFLVTTRCFIMVMSGRNWKLLPTQAAEVYTTNTCGNKQLNKASPLYITTLLLTLITK